MRNTNGMLPYPGNYGRSQKMKTKVTNNAIPSISIIGESLGKIDYADAYKIEIDNPKKVSIDTIASLLPSSSPKWADSLMKLRNFLVRFVGLRVENFPQPVAPKNWNYKPGDSVGFFKVFKRNTNEIVFAENDKHLNFQTALLLEVIPGSQKQYLYSITLVHFNNLLGRLYFFPVKPFHKLIIKALLRRMARDINS